MGCGGNLPDRRRGTQRGLFLLLPGKGRTLRREAAWGREDSGLAERREQGDHGRDERQLPDIRGGLHNAGNDQAGAGGVHAREGQVGRKRQRVQD